MDTSLIRVTVLGAFAAFGLAAPAAGADKLDTAAFVTACTEDPTVTEDPGFEAGGAATPKAFCECVAGKLVENKSSQADVDMLTKLHNEEISDSDAETHPNFENLLVANEGYEDACRQSLGLSTDYGTDIEETPMEEEVPEGEAPDGEAPLEDSPPE